MVEVESPFQKTSTNQRNQTGHDFDRSKTMDLPISSMFFFGSGRNTVFFSLRLPPVFFLVGGFFAKPSMKKYEQVKLDRFKKKNRIEKSQKCLKFHHLFSMR